MLASAAAASAIQNAACAAAHPGQPQAGGQGTAQQQPARGPEQHEQHRSGHRGQPLVARRVSLPGDVHVTDLRFPRGHGKKLGTAHPPPTWG